VGLLPFFSPLLRSPSLFPSPIFPCFPSASLFPPLFLLHFHFIPFPYFSAPCPFFPSLSPPLKLATRSGGAQRGPERSSGRQRISCILTPVNRRLISEIFRYHDVRKNFTKLKPTSAGKLCSIARQSTSQMCSSFVHRGETWSTRFFNR